MIYLIPMCKSDFTLGKLLVTRPTFIQNYSGFEKNNALFSATYKQIL